MNIKTIVEKTFAKVKDLKSYRCVMELYSWENDHKAAKQLFLYRVPGDIRIEQIGAWEKGAIVVIRSNGRIRAQAGGLLSFLKFNLDKNSRWLKGITGDSAIESDWISIFLKFKKMTPFVVKAECKSVNVNLKPGFDLTTHLKDQPYDKARFILRRDGPILLLERFRKRKLITRINWKDIKLNVKVDDTDFDL
jgi:hypothetical protein